MKTKKPTKHDLSILAVSLFIGIVIGWALKAIHGSLKPPITIENPVNTALIKRNDSLAGVVAIKDSLWKASEKENRVTDSILINNNKVIKKDYGKLKEMDDSTFYKYLKSRFGTR